MRLGTKSTIELIYISEHHHCFIVQVTGLCGDFDRDSRNDFRLMNGDIVQDVKRFVREYTVSDRCEEEESETPYLSACVQSQEFSNMARDLCEKLRTGRLPSQLGAVHE